MMTEFFEQPKKKKTAFLIIPLAILIFLIFISAGIASYDALFIDEVYPGVRIGGYNIGGLTRPELKDLIENMNNRYAKEGIDLRLERDSGIQLVKINTVAGGESAVEMIRLDSEALSAAALMVGRESESWRKFIMPIVYRFRPINILVPAVINKPVLVSSLKAALTPHEDLVRDANIKSIDLSSMSAELMPEKSGQVFDYDEAVEKIKLNLTRLSFEPVGLKPRLFRPSIVRGDIQAALPNLWPMLQTGPVNLAADTAPSTSLSWSLSESDIAGFVEARRDERGEVVFFLNQNKVENYFKSSIIPSVEVPAKDAKFTIENNRVSNFEPSVAGMAVDMEASYRNLNESFLGRGRGEPSGAVAVVTKQVLPRVQLSESNDLGIVELIGAGTSTFKDSHTNRIKNIANAVKRLNGVLIPPGEVFSSIKYAGPFTSESGFLPEQIIRGRRIETEVGGGMCQIGTTLFRMAMNTGLDIVERHNHSLVVQYYADPVNGNPGTDATLYEPTLDLKFLNDTGHYMMLLTDINYKKQMLTFSLWGTRDGRSGWYSRPLVSKWIPAPTAIEYVPMDSKKSASTACQSAFRGAKASFTYSRVTPAGERVDRVFDSYYRPLPKICPATTTPASI